MLLELIENVAFLVALAVSLQMLARRMEGRPALNGLATGLLFGAVGIAGMMAPMHFAPGVIYDGRSIVLSLAGLFGGPVAALLAAMMCGAYRLYLGGAGVLAGMGTVIEAAALGTALHYLRRRDEAWVGPARLWAFALLVHVVMLALQLLIPNRGWDVLQRVGPSVLLFYPIGFLVIAQVFLDSERRRKSEEALRASERKYRELVENANSIILRTDQNGNVLFFNEYAQQFLGYSEKEIVGRNVVGTIIPEVRGNGRDSQSTVMDVVRHPGQCATNETETLRKNGETVWVAWTNKAVPGADPASHEVLCVGLDITERKQAEETLRKSEEKWRRLFMSTPIGIFHSTPSGEFIDVNPAAASMLKYASPEEMVREVNKTSIPEALYANPPRHSQLLQQTMKESGGWVQTENQYRCKDGSTITANVHVKLLDSSEGAPGVLEGFLTDITERKRAEEALTSSLSMLNAALESTADGILIVDRNGRMTRWNQKFADMWEIPEDLLSSHSDESALNYVLDLVDQPNAFLAKVRELYGQPEASSVDQLVLVDGRIFERHSQPQRIGDSIVGRVWSFRDITERKRAEEAMRHAHERLRCFVDANIVGVIVASPSGAVIEANDYYLRMIGYTREEFEQGTVDWRAITPREWLPADEHAIKELRERGICTPYEKEYVRRDGTRVSVFLSDAMLPGTEEQIAAYCLDITERKRAEEALRTLLVRNNAILAAIPDIIMEVDDCKRYTWANQSGLRFFGEDVLGREASYYFEGEQETYTRVQPLFNGSEDVIYLESWQRRRDGEKRLLSWWCIVLKDKQGRVTGALSSGRDITEQKRAEKERLALERQVQHAQKLESLGVLAGGIAHDFNNLLMAILGNADLALDALSPMSPARGNIEEVEKAAKRAAELAKQMLAYSGKGRFVIEPIDAGKLVEEMAHLLEVSISKKAVLKYNFTRNLPTFDGDATQVRQIIMNLITNASEAIGEKSGVIALSTGAMHCDRAYLDGANEVLRAAVDKPLPEGVYVYFEVADTGCGMNAATIERIFNPFFTTKFTGRGLGMSAVLGIVRGHKGAIRIYSEVGRGTTFKVLFPANELPDGDFAVRRPDQAAGKDWRGTGTILLADDEESVCAVGRQMLERMGFTVLTAPDGREALEIFSEHADEIVCVLLDLTMPHMDGEETFREMRRLRPGITVVLCSGYNEQDAVQRFAGKGLAGFIQKPYGIAALKEKLRGVLKKQ